MNLKNIKGISLIIIILIIVAILIIGAIVTGVIIINKNKNKQAITAEEFKDKMEEMDYIIVDAKEQFASYDYIEKVYLAVSEDYEYKIEFYEMDEKEQAISFYNTNKDIFDSYKESTSIGTNVSIGNNSKYTLTTGNKYRLLSRIDNTVIFVNVDKDYKDKINEALKEIGY